MPNLPFAREDMARAMELVSAFDRPPTDGELERLAFVVGIERRSHDPETVTTGELRFAHDLLYIGAVPGRTSGLRESLALALLGRGHVPAPDEYEGTWWLWWPSQGRGVCQRCGQGRQLRLYSSLWGKPFRYLCRRCRDEEIAEETEELDRAVAGKSESPAEGTAD